MPAVSTCDRRKAEWLHSRQGSQHATAPCVLEEIMQFSRTHNFLLLALVLALAGCGGGGSNPMTPGPTPGPQPQAASSTVGVSIGDAPADWIMTFGMTVNSITLTSSGGQTVNLLSSPTSMEMMQLMGSLRPLAIASVPQGTY